MQLKQALLGAVIGGAVGAGLLIAAYFLFGIEHTALAIVVAIVTGFGVRTLAATKGHASYLRGALTCLIALAAFMGGKLLVAEIAVRQTAVRAAQPLRASAPPAESDTSAESAEKSDAAAPAVREAERGARQMSTARVARPTTFSPWDFIWLSVAALVAYELGRGSGIAAPVPATPG